MGQRGSDGQSILDGTRWETLREGSVFVSSIRRFERAVSPAIGTLLVVALTLLVASTITATLVAYDDDLDEYSSQFDAVSDDTPWIGSPSGLAQQSSNEAGATDVRYRIQLPITPAKTGPESLDRVDLEVTTGSPDMFSDTSEAELEYVFIDENGDGQADVFITTDVTGWNSLESGTEMEVSFDGAYSPEEGDELVMVFGGVDNPTSPGTYTLRAKTNQQFEWTDGTVTII